MTPAQNRALRSVLLSNIRHLDRFIMYLETTPGIVLKDTIYEGIRTETSYLRAVIRAAVQQLEDKHDNANENPSTRRGAGLSEPTRSSSG